MFNPHRHRVPRLLATATTAPATATATATAASLHYIKRTPASNIGSCRPPPVAPATATLRFFSLSPTTMASDQDYAAFLDKANQDTGGSAATAGQSRIGTKAVDTDVVPAGLRQVDEYLISDADEPFEPVSLKWGRDDLPSEADFGRLIGHDGAVATIAQSDFDPRGQYTKVVQAVKQASGNDVVGFYRAQHGRTRAEYWVVGVEGGSKAVVGLKAVAVES